MIKNDYYNTDFFKLLVFNLFLTIMISTGLLDRSFSFLLLSLLAAFIITKPLKESLLAFLVSIPLFIGLPLGVTLDTTSIWRPLSVLLVTRWVWERRDILWRRPLVFWQALWERKELLWLSIALGCFIFIATISLFWASDLTIGIKTIIYFINIFAIAFLYAWEVGREDLSLFLQRSLIPVSIAVIIGFLQLGLTFVVLLYDFWQWWAANPILVYYGSKTSHLVNHSNTWFAYYGKNIPATLRMFSFFQDSHSFAMFMIISVGLWGIFFLFFADKHDKKGLWLSGGSAAVSLLAIILSGSRGAWFGALLLFLSLLIIHFYPQKRLLGMAPLVKRGIIGLVVFFLLFPLSSLLLAAQQKAQLILEGRGGEVDLRLAFLRARSTFDLEELSNKGRLEIWADSYRFLRDHKFLQGTGIGNFPTVLALLPEKSRLGASAHSLYLQIFVELGLAGLLSLLAILFLIIKQALSLISERSGETNLFITLQATSYKLQTYFAFCFLFSFTWIAFYSLVDVTLLNDKVLLLFAILTGMLYSVERQTAGRG